MKSYAFEIKKKKKRRRIYLNMFFSFFFKSVIVERAEACILLKCVNT